MFLSGHNVVSRSCDASVASARLEQWRKTFAGAVHGSLLFPVELVNPFWFKLNTLNMQQIVDIVILEPRRGSFYSPPPLASLPTYYYSY
jgi:hypothetical protein